MSDDRLTPSEIEKFIAADYVWDLETGILICLAYDPSQYDWENHQGNDFPVRLRADCLTAIGAGQLVAVEKDAKKGCYRIKRDELIPFCFEHSKLDCQQTHSIWKAYKKARAATKNIKVPSLLEQEMDKAFTHALLEEYAKYRHLYDANKKRLSKKQLYAKILKSNPAWEEETLRRSGKKFDIGWAQKNFAVALNTN